MKSLQWIIIIHLLFVPTTRASGQPWKYLGKYDPKADLTFQKTLDKEACSITSGSEVFAGEKSTYKTRTFCIQSFDGTRSKIAFSEIHHGHTLSIAGPDTTIEIDDISGLVKIHFLRPELLEVVYSPRGGSDQGFEYVMILGVNKNRLCFISEFLTINESVISHEYHLHEVHLKLQNQRLGDYQLTANVRDMLKASVHRSKNYDRKSVYVLRFDGTRKIFYNRIEHLNAAFRIDSSSARPSLLNGDYPTVDLGPNEKYYYIGDTWYALTSDDSGNKSIMSKVH